MSPQAKTLKANRTENRLAAVRGSQSRSEISIRATLWAFFSDSWDTLDGWEHEAQKLRSLTFCARIIIRAILLVP
jgi:hypothetical protein